jgi:hypothetical protein
LISFISELNQLELWGADIGNVYLEPKTAEKLYIAAGPEFKDKEGQILVITWALFGLRTSGKMWHQRFSDCLQDCGFAPSKADADVWIRKSSDGQNYYYLAVYVDDIMIAMKDPVLSDSQREIWF